MDDARTMPSLRSIAGILLAAAFSASAWNTDVHQQIGFMAEKFLTDYTTSVLAQILEPEYNGSIGNAAAWADAYAHTDEGAFSYQWHWIDSADDVRTRDTPMAGHWRLRRAERRSG